MLVLGAVVCYFLPRRKTPIQLAALTAALLIGFELTVAHWFYPYIPWFFPFVVFVVLAPRARRRAQPDIESDRQARELVPAG
jgi:CHASE2 domain-containing sensor protein